VTLANQTAAFLDVLAKMLYTYMIQQLEATPILVNLDEKTTTKG
jgi:hypothetical protein